MPEKFASTSGATRPDFIVESKSYDYVPESQRHGNARQQVPFWFMINATLITLFTGAIGPNLGLGLAWTLVAILTGSAFGTFFSAFHAAQGPGMGLPQMIQSRVQFGTRGSVIPLAAAALVGGGFSIFNIQLAADSLSEVTSTPTTLYQWGLTILGVGIAIVGYNLIHRVERWLSILAVANLVLLTIAVVVELPIGNLLSTGGFVGVAFIAQFGASASYQIAVAPIVSDYTRYLPSTTRTAPIVGAVFGGTLASAVWIESLGAVIAASSPGGDVVAEIASVGNQFGFSLGTITLTLAVIVLTSVYSVSLYSAAVAVLTMIESFVKIRSTATLRAVCLTVIGVLTLAAGLLLSEDFLANFSGFLAILTYLLIPWTAVNLVDFYLVRKGTYSITDILRPDGGIYGYWNVKGLTAYFVGFIAMIPFFSTLIWAGPAAQALDGADIAPIIGLIVASITYWLLMRNHPLAEEMTRVAAADIKSVPTHAR